MRPISRSRKTRSSTTNSTRRCRASCRGSNSGAGKKELYGRTLGSGLGWSVGASIGIKMAKPDRQVVCLLGDGAFMMGQIEALWAARRFEAPVLYIVFNNRSYNDTRMRVTSIAPKLRDLKLDMAAISAIPMSASSRQPRHSTSRVRL